MLKIKDHGRKKGQQMGEKEEMVLLERTQSSLDSDEERAPHFVQQHKSTCHNVHYC